MFPLMSQYGLFGTPDNGYSMGRRMNPYPQQMWNGNLSDSSWGGPGVLPDKGDNLSAQLGVDPNPASSLPDPQIALPGSQYKPDVNMDGVNAMTGNPIRTQQKPQKPLVQPQGSPTNLMNFSGLLTNPNIFSRLGEGYNRGGLFGALGLALTDMNPNSAANQAQAAQSDEWMRYLMMNNLQRGQ